MSKSPLSTSKIGICLNIRVIPRASRSEISGLHGDALKVRIKAPPLDGKANSELLKFLAKQLKTPLRSLQILTGETGRNKKILITGLKLPEVAERLHLS